ncbi:MAG: hypothetical protein ACM3S2_05810 [Ignavibacteriales bacterium]
MKKIFFILILSSTFAFGQFRNQLGNQPKVHDGMVNDSAPRMILGFINPNNFQMHHSYSLSYSSFGGNGLAMGVYTNSMAYKFSDKLNIQLDASLVHTPYSSFSKQLTDQINGVYISRAQLNYRPSENFMINIQYNNGPANYYSPYGYWNNVGLMDQGPWDNSWLYRK